MKSIIWMIQPGMEPYARCQQSAWMQALEAEGWSVRVQHHQPRVPWRSTSSAEWLIWNFVPTPLDVWIARLFAGRQMAVLSELNNKVYSLPRLDQWCVPSESMRMHLVDCGVSRDKIEIVQGYAPSKSKMMPDVRGQVGRDENSPVIYASGPLVPSTGNRLAIWFFSIMQYMRPGISLLLQRDGPERERLERMADGICTKGSVRFAANDIPAHELVAQADIVCLPLAEDGVPDALFAALSQAKPIVATQQPSLMEWLRHDVNGVLIPTNRPPTWAAVMDQLLHDTERIQRLRAGARMTAIPSARLKLPAVFCQTAVPHVALAAA
ncbi:MAG TPA: glycosyltransferase family 4 protein [Gemmatales bacterium]|nr:glycosyltransferase family 4 protein [Gemmatales bacterium]